ncbi:Uncharacterised protein [Mycobacterium tuberculosis]|nr:Uncharacterised protein [Mycobacterium tuberculosis]
MNRLLYIFGNWILTQEYIEDFYTKFTRIFNSFVRIYDAILTIIICRRLSIRKDNEKSLMMTATN